MAVKNKTTTPVARPRGVRRIPQHSILYDRVVPALLVLLAGVLVVIILIALAILFGLGPSYGQ